MEKTLDVESIEDERERIVHDFKIIDATDRMIERDPDFWDKVDRFKNRSSGPQWLK